MAAQQSFRASADPSPQVTFLVGPPRARVEAALALLARDASDASLAVCPGPVAVRQTEAWLRAAGRSAEGRAVELTEWLTWPAQDRARPTVLHLPALGPQWPSPTLRTALATACSRGHAATVVQASRPPDAGPADVSSAEEAPLADAGSVRASVWVMDAWAPAAVAEALLALAALQPSNEAILVADPEVHDATVALQAARSLPSSVHSVASARGAVWDQVVVATRGLTHADELAEAEAWVRSDVWFAETVDDPTAQLQRRLAADASASQRMAPALVRKYLSVSVPHVLLSSSGSGPHPLELPTRDYLRLARGLGTAGSLDLEQRVRALSAACGLGGAGPTVGPGLTLAPPGPVSDPPFLDTLELHSTLALVGEAHLARALDQARGTKVQAELWTREDVSPARLAHRIDVPDRLAAGVGDYLERESRVDHLRRAYATPALRSCLLQGLRAHLAQVYGDDPDLGVDALIAAMRAVPVGEVGAAGSGLGYCLLPSCVTASGLARLRAGAERAARGTADGADLWRAALFHEVLHLRRWGERAKLLRAALRAEPHPLPWSAAADARVHARLAQVARAFVAQCVAPDADTASAAVLVRRDLRCGRRLCGTVDLVVPAGDPGGSGPLTVRCVGTSLRDEPAEDVLQACLDLATLPGAQAAWAVNLWLGQARCVSAKARAPRAEL